MTHLDWLRNRWLQLLLITLLGGILRFTQLSSAPLGYFHDEAWSAEKARSIITDTESPAVYFPENNGMDALHVYLIALIFQFTGPVAIGSRLASALVGTLTIPVTYWLAAELLADDRHRHAIALGAAFVIATLFGAVVVSRSGWHAMSMALFATACLAALARGRRLNLRRWFIVAGVLAGITQYTYPSARLLPVLLLGQLILDLVRNRSARRTIVVNYLAAGVAALIAFAPLGAYFIQHPEWLFVRAQQTSEDGNLLQNAANVALGFIVRGDLDSLHNISGRPALDPFLAIWFVIGLGVCWRQRRREHLGIIAGLIVMSLPTVLTTPAPLTRRWTGAMPFEALIVAIGAVALADWLLPRLKFSRRSIILTSAFGVLFLLSAIWSAADYFGLYVSNPQFFWDYDGGITQVANYLAAQSPAKVYLTPYDRFYQVVTLTLDEAHHAPIQSYNGATCALFPEQTDQPTMWLVITEKDQRTLPLMKKLFPNNQVVWRLDSPVGSYARALQVSAGQRAQLSLSHWATADWDSTIQLIGFDLPATARPGEVLNIQLALKDTASLNRLHKVFVHLRGSADQVVAQDDRAPCDDTLNEADWRPGDVLLQEFQLHIPSDLAPGSYPIAIGLYEAQSGARLPILSSELVHDRDSLVIGAVQIASDSQ
ncbi:MAG: glycosyltransferase family 39 protein [Anaerolineae bacterium]